MSIAPLTHHQIVGLVEPFTRGGLQVDLAASDRAARRLVFRTRPAAGAPEIAETLRLDCRQAGRFVLERVLSHPGGLQATLQAAGAQPAALLAAVDAVAPARQFLQGEGFLVARSYELLSAAGGTAALFMARAVARFDGLTVTLALRMPRMRSVAGDLALAPAEGVRLELPEDLLAVLGWDWSRLLRGRSGWTAKLRLRGAALRRSRTAEAALERMAPHLARVLAEPPARFHDRLVAARWGVFFRRAIPLLTVLLAVGGALLLPLLTDTNEAGHWFALQYVPIAALAVGFSLQELPRFEIPPLPRRARSGRWRAPPDREDPRIRSPDEP